MTVAFWSLAALMAAAALLFILPPLLRGARGSDEATRKLAALVAARDAGVIDAAEYARKRSALAGDAPTTRRPRGLSFALAVLIPLTAFALYRELGEPRALDPALRAPVGGAEARLVRPGSQPAEAAESAQSAQSPAAEGAPPSMEQAVAGLAERMRSTPDDLDGWMLLGRAYKTMENFPAAREALSNAFRLAPEDPDVLVEFAEAQALSSEPRRIGGEPLLLIERALAIQPQHQRGLWLLGISSLQAGVPGEAVTIWENRLLPLVEGDARDSLLEQIASAREAAGLPPRADAPAATASTAAPAMPAAPAPAAPAPAATGDARLTVSVDIAPELKSKVGASDVLFVYARAVEGPRMPLAIQRLPAGSLPVQVVLDDSTSMMPELKLSTMPQVVVGARISKSGLATPQSGDFETVSAPVASRGAAPLTLVIDRVVP